MSQTNKRIKVSENINSGQDSSGTQCKISCNISQDGSPLLVENKDMRRLREETYETNDNFDDSMITLHNPHYLGVVPTFQLGSEYQKIRSLSLGLLGCLQDEQLLDILCQLDAQSLARFGCCSKHCYVFANTDDLWKHHVLAGLRSNYFTVPPGMWHFQGTWNKTFVYLYQHRKTTSLDMIPCENNEGGTFHFGPVASDVLFDAWLSATASIRSIWLKNNNIPRRVSNDLSAKDFVVQYEQQNTPVIIVGAAQDWEAIAKWSPESLVAELGSDHLFEAFDEFTGSYKMTIASYLNYARHQRDERPLYIFDPHFVEYSHKLRNSYTVPEQFEHDMMSFLGSSRPDWRWLLIGPSHSGTNFHVDPNHTSAWNTVIYGRKKCIMFPPHILPPGIQVCKGTGRVEQNDSVIAWFLHYYDKIHQDPLLRRHVKECLCNPGDTLFIPDGWWHLILNLEETVAITQNYVSPSNLQRCLTFLRTGHPQYMSHAGPPDLEDRFKDVLEKHVPKLVVQALQGEKPLSISLNVANIQGRGTIQPFSFNFMQSDKI